MRSSKPLTSAGRIQKVGSSGILTATRGLLQKVNIRTIKYGQRKTLYFQTRNYGPKLRNVRNGTNILRFKRIPYGNYLHRTPILTVLKHHIMSRAAKISINGGVSFMLRKELFSIRNVLKYICLFLIFFHQTVKELKEW